MMGKDLQQQLEDSPLLKALLVQLLEQAGGETRVSAMAVEALRNGRYEVDVRWAVEADALEVRLHDSESIETLTAQGLWCDKHKRKKKAVRFSPDEPEIKVCDECYDEAQLPSLPLPPPVPKGRARPSVLAEG